MKKVLVLLTIMILFFSLTAVSAYSSGRPTIQCQKFSIDIPEGFEKTEAWSDYDKPVNEVFLGTGIPKKGEVHRYLIMDEVSSFPKFSKKIIVYENYTDGNLKIFKCRNPKEDVFENFTLSEFNKEGHHFVIFINYAGDITRLNMNDEVKLVKDIKESTSIK